MKNSQSSISSRRQDMLAYIQEQETVNLLDLVDRYNVSISTIRRDLDTLSAKGLITRNYGNAVSNPRVRVDQNISRKQKIAHMLAQYAASFVEDNETIFINTSSTALLIASYIKGKDVTIITNNANAINSEHDPHIQLILTGGELRKPKYSLTGDFALNTINRIQADKCFIGCSGCSTDGGITTAVHSEASVNCAMIERCAGKVFLLADSTKIGKQSNFFYAPVSAVDYLITNNEAKGKGLEEIARKNVTVIRLDENNPPVIYSHTESETGHEAENL